jgi:hypothetical protein
VFDDGGLVVPGSTTVDELGLNARDVDGERRFALKGKRGVFEGVGVDQESQAADVGVVFGDVEVDGCPLFITCIALADVLVLTTRAVLGPWVLTL